MISNFVYTFKMMYFRGREVRDAHLTCRGGVMFFFRSEMFFRTTRELEYFFLSREARNLFSRINIRLYVKNHESVYFFSSTKIRIFFLGKNHTPPPFKLNGRSLNEWKPKPDVHMDMDKT